MAYIKVHTDILERFFSAIRPTSLTGTEVTEKSAHEIAEQAVENARTIVQEEFYVRSGTLLNSLRPIVRSTTAGIEAGVGSLAPHSAYLEYGTEPHRIRPRSVFGYLMSYPDHPPETALREPRRRVNHPGNPDFRFLQRAVRRAAGLSE